MNRLTHITQRTSTDSTTTEHQKWASYNASGNILWKKDMGHYCYKSNRPHAVSSIQSSACNGSEADTWHYDNWGNMTSSPGRSIVYSAFDKATSITKGTKTTRFNYDASHNRYERITDLEGTKQERTLYLGSVERIYERDSASDDWVFKEARRNLGGVIQTIHSSGKETSRFLHKDNLGSLTSITDENNRILQKFYFDPWGKKHQLPKHMWSSDAQANQAPTLAGLLDITPRGFTGHEHVDHADIIHMNGRIYDPTLGRFLQADPFIQSPDNSQSYNRYSYLMNRPLSGTDPSGYFGIFKKIGRNIIRAAVKVFGAEIVAFAGNVASLFCGPWAPACAAGWNYEFTRAMGGSSSQALRGAFTAAVTTYAFQQIGGHFRAQSAANVNAVAWEGASYSSFYDFGGNLLTGGQVAQQIAAHAAVGGVAAELQGGKFGHGFFSAGVTKGLGGAFLPGGSNLSTGQVVQGAAVSAVIGGTASVISGGKFANGARTATFQYLYNQAQKGAFSPAVADEETKKVMRMMEALAQDATNEYDAACNNWECAAPWRRGIGIHSLFAKKVAALGPEFIPEQTYKDRFPDVYGVKGGIRADAIWGDEFSPRMAFELKTGLWDIRWGELSLYRQHLPYGTGLHYIWTERQVGN